VPAKYAQLGKNCSLLREGHPVREVRKKVVGDPHAGALFRVGRGGAPAQPGEPAGTRGAFPGGEVFEN